MAGLPPLIEEAGRAVDSQVDPTQLPFVTDSEPDAQDPAELSEGEPQDSGTPSDANGDQSATGLGLDIDAELVSLVQRLTMPEKEVREVKIRLWRELHEYWRTNAYLIWDDAVQDFRSPEELAIVEKSLDIDPKLFAKQVNIYRAHGEAIIAALTTNVPSVRFMPDDADVVDDVMTARARGRLAKKIENDNSAPLLLMKAIFHLFNEGVVFGYCESKADKQYGVDQIESYAPVNHTTRQLYCAACGADLGVQLDPTGAPQPQSCPNCGYVDIPEFEDTQTREVEFVGLKDVPREQEVVEVFGGLHVQVPSYLPSIAGLRLTPYIRLDDEIHVELLREMYPEFADKISAGANSYEDYERAARQDSSYFDNWTVELATYSRVWLRPWTFNAIARDPQSDDRVKALKEKFPNGVYVVINRNTLLEAVPDCIEEHWVASQHPLSMHIHADPIGKPLKPIQDITNELVNLGLESVEFGISEIFADTEVLNFGAYKNSEAKPGQIFPVKRRAGENLNQAFYETQKSTLSQEYGPFAEKMEQMGQFVVGSTPSIWGGALQGGSGTAREYELSRAQALQRLTIIWVMVKQFWCDLMKVGTEDYIKNLTGDVKFVQSSGDSYTNVWIRQSELHGKVGKVEPEISEAFPVSWSQKRDALLNLIQLKDPAIGQILMHPENVGTVRDLLGFDDLYVPGDDDRNKQLAEIAEMIQGQPILSGQINPMTGEPVLIPTVQIDVELDDHEVEYSTCIAWLKSDTGRAMKEVNPAGWMNVRAHALLHLQQYQMQQAQMAQQQSEQNNADSGTSSGQPASNS